MLGNFSRGRLARIPVNPGLDHLRVVVALFVGARGQTRALHPSLTSGNILTGRLLANLWHLDMLPLGR